VWKSRCICMHDMKGKQLACMRACRASSHLAVTWSWPVAISVSSSSECVWICCTLIRSAFCWPGGICIRGRYTWKADLIISVYRSGRGTSIFNMLLHDMMYIDMDGSDTVDAEIWTVQDTRQAGEICFTPTQDKSVLSS